MYIDDFALERFHMVETQLKERYVKDQQLLEVMRTTPRHLFIPEFSRRYAYEDRPLDIGYGQTISQPYIVAFMTEAARIDKDSKVLEIGTGSGYQAAILAQLCKEVYTVEIIEPLAEATKKLLAELGYINVHVHIGDGYKGWPNKAPFDVIIATAAPPKLPFSLADQLKEGGRLIIPVGTTVNQELLRIIRTKDGIKQEELLPVRFVPMVEKE